MFVNIVISGYKQGGTELIVGTLFMPDGSTVQQATAIANADPVIASCLSRVIFIGVAFGTVAGRTSLRYLTTAPT